VEPRRILLTGLEQRGESLAIRFEQAVSNAVAHARPELLCALWHGGIEHAVVRRALAPVADEPELAQLGEMARDARLSEAGDLGQLGHAELFGSEQCEQAHAGAV